jgi:hypothetical protein
MSSIAMEIQKCAVGDWVQVTANEIVDSGGDGSLRIIAAECRDVGHILEEIEPDWVNVYFERTGAVCACDVSELIRLGGPETGRAP